MKLSNSLLFYFLFSCGSVFGDGPPLVESLIQVWNQRVNSLSSAEFQWNSQRFTSARLFEVIPAGPTKDLSYSEECALSVHWPEYRYSRDALSWSSKQKQRLRSPYLSVSDGHVAKVFWSTPPDGAAPSGTIYREPLGPDVSRSIPTAPLMLICRPFGYGNPGIELTPEHIRKNWSLVTLNEHRTVKIDHQTQGRLFELWASSKDEFRICQFQISSNGRVTWRCEFEYTTGRTSYMPSGWKLRSFDRAGNMQEGYDCRITYVTLNRQIPIERFSIEFPVGTFVHDQRTGKTNVVKEKDEER